MRATVCELPLARQARYARDWAISAADAETLLADRPTADLLDAAAAAGGDVKVVARQLLSFWSAEANKRGVSVGGLGVSAEQMAELANLVARGEIIDLKTAFALTLI